MSVSQSVKPVWYRIGLDIKSSLWVFMMMNFKAVGLNLSMPRLGGALNSYLIPKIFEMNQSLEEPMYVSTFICFVCSFVYKLVKQLGLWIDFGGHR